ADQITVRRYQCAAGVAWIDGGIGLDEIFEGGQSELGAAGGADNALGNGLTNAEWITDGEHHIADLGSIGATDIDHWQVLESDPQDRQIGVRIGAYQGRIGKSAVR